jgi:1-acyl-sn-glycerol-3-phosphate acyltransferase
VPKAVGQLRSALGLLLALASFVPVALLQRLLLWPLLALLPSWRLPVMSRLMRIEAWVVLKSVEIGGARLCRNGTIPTGSPSLILMNHQSLLDIPTAIRMGAPCAPLFVTRRRYARGVPMVSLMLRLLGCPLIDPDAEPRAALKLLKEAAAQTTSAILIFPEGHRSRDGAVIEFQRAGIQIMLKARPMPVYLLVTEGFWHWGRMEDSFFGVGGIRGRTDALGPFQPPADATLPAFVDEMRAKMVAHLQRMRDEAREQAS